MQLQLSALLSLDWEIFLPWSALLSLLLVLFLVYLNKENIRSGLSAVRKESWLIVSLIFILAFTLNLTVPIQVHRGLDDYFYMDQASHLMKDYSILHNSVKGYAWPLFLSFTFFLLKLSNTLAIYTTILFGALTTIAIFLLAYLLTRNEKIALFSSLVYAFMPPVVKWSATASWNIGGIFFLALSMASFVLYYKNPSRKTLWLSFALIALSAQFSAVNFILFPLFFVGHLLLGKKAWPRLHFLLSLFITLLLVLPTLFFNLSLFAGRDMTYDETAGATKGTNFSADNLLSNLIRYYSLPFFSEYYPLIFSILSLMGIIFLFLRRTKEASVLLAWQLIILFGFSILWTTLFESTTDRYLLYFIPIIAVFSACGIYLITHFAWRLAPNPLLATLFLGLILLLVFLSAISYAGNYTIVEDSGTAHNLLESRVVEQVEKDSPPGCIMLVASMYYLPSTTELELVLVQDFLDVQQVRDSALNRSCILFFEDKGCYEDLPVDIPAESGYLFQLSNRSEYCGLLKREYEMKPLTRYSYANITYTLYQLSNYISGHSQPEIAN